MNDADSQIIAKLRERVRAAEAVIKAFRKFTGWPIGSAHGDDVRKAFDGYAKKYGLPMKEEGNR